MAYRWTEQTIRWYCDAAVYTGFFHHLAGLLQEYLPQEETVCDLGCGIGCLALELAALGYRTTAVDHDRMATQWLQGVCRQRAGPRPSVLCRDWNDLGPGPRWDNIIMVNAGRTAEETMLFRRLCAKRLLLVNRTHKNSHVRADGGASARRHEIRRDYGTDCLAHRTFSMEFGQPFTSMEEARAYVSEMSEGQGTAEVLSGLVATGDAAFPLYLPYRKELELFLLPAI